MSGNASNDFDPLRGFTWWIVVLLVVGSLFLLTVPIELFKVRYLMTAGHTIVNCGRLVRAARPEWGDRNDRRDVFWTSLPSTEKRNYRIRDRRGPDFPRPILDSDEDTHRS